MLKKVTRRIKDSEKKKKNCSIHSVWDKEEEREQKYTQINMLIGMI